MPEQPLNPDPGITCVDLQSVARDAAGDGVAWTLAGGEDLNVNAVHLGGGAGIAAHTNDEVDVLIVVVNGAGWLESGDDIITLNPSTLAYIERGVGRAVRAAPGGLDYLSVHRRRAGLRVADSRER